MELLYHQTKHKFSRLTQINIIAMIYKNKYLQNLKYRGLK